jgi:3-oxoacyl-[acyl-carrier-protein] synthase II
MLGKSGVTHITTFPTEKLDCKVAGQIQDFDPTLWISKKELPHVPRTVPMAIAAAQEALQDAGLAPEELSLEERRNFGVIIGTGGGGVEFLERQYQFYFENEHRKNSVYAIPSNTLGSLSSEISMRFSLKGLSHVISTGCTSSTDAIGYALHHIESGRLTRILCGGVDAPITPAIMTGFDLMKVVSRNYNHIPERASRPFSKDRDGFVLGEGSWIFLVEEKASALARGAKIYAEISGYGSTCEAYHRVRLDSNAEEPARAIVMALAEAGLNPKRMLQNWITSTCMGPPRY